MIELMESVMFPLETERSPPESSQKQLTLLIQQK